MNKIKMTAATVGVGLIVSTAVMYRGADAKEAATYKTAAVTRASLKATVSATGTLNAVRTVQVGTQVSGQVSKIYVDFNDHVKKGELLATIDPTLQQQAVQDAQAQLERAQATLALAQSDYERNKQLFDAKVLSASEFSTTQSNFAVQQATVKSAQISLDRARQNLSYTAIYAPIDGVIVERNVDVGQTVAASLSAPQLFLIANDLSEMQILASVDEGDIGAITDGLPVEFTVQAYPNQTFAGSVKQVRLQSTTVDNVVSYTAVVSVKNDGKLRPGMTATVKFLTASADNVLTVPNSALRIAATPEMRADAGITTPSTTGGAQSTGRSGAASAPTTAGTSAAGASTAGTPTAGTPTAGTPTAGTPTAGTPTAGAARAGYAGRSGSAGRGALLWTVDSTGKYSAIRVKTGLTDGQKTEVQGTTLKEGEQVIVSLTAAAGTAQSAATTNPLSPQRPGGGRGGF
jgi:HlyD family secretion protein